jgi:hypothetical protein
MTKKPKTQGLAKGKRATRRSHVPGTVPRTYAHAKSLGLKRTKTGYNDLSDELKEGFTQLSDIGSRSGSICGIGPSPNQGKMLVCYKDESGRCNWVEMDKGVPPATHA